MKQGRLWTTHILLFADSLVSTPNLELLLNVEDQYTWNDVVKHVKLSFSLASKEVSYCVRLFLGIYNAVNIDVEIY